MSSEIVSQSTILIAATCRSGSYLACDWLSQLSRIPFAEEYFNFRLMTARQELGLSGDMPVFEVLEYLMAQQRSTSGVFAVKTMWPAFASLFTQIAADSTVSVVDPVGNALDVLGDVQVLFVRRRDKDKQAVSFEKAKQQRVWRSEQGERRLDSGLVYNYPRILDCWDQVHQDEAAWLQFLQERKLPYYEIWYEDMVADPMGVVGNALRFLGVEANPNVVIQSRYQKLSSGLNAEWLERFQLRQRAQLSTVDDPAAVSGQHRLGVGNCSSRPVVDLRCLNVDSIQMSPDSVCVVECELTNTGTNAWLPVINSDGNANYYVELRERAIDASEDPLVLWRTDVEELPRRGEVVSVSLRLSLGLVLDDFECDLFFCYPGGATQSHKSISVQITLDEKWKFMRNVFGEVSASDCSDWLSDCVNVPVLGDILIKSFPFIYQSEHGWLYVDAVNSSPGIFCSTDFELKYLALHLNEPSIYFVWIDEDPQRLEFLGTRNALRAFRNPETGEVLSYPLSSKPTE